MTKFPCFNQQICLFAHVSVNIFSKLAGQLQNKCSKFQIKVLHFILLRIPVDGVKKLPNMRFFVRHEVLALCFDSEVYIDSSELQQ